MAGSTMKGAMTMTTLTGMGQRALANIPALADLSDRVLFGEVWERENWANATAAW
jgi:hypothetical protein